MMSDSASSYAREIAGTYNIATFQVEWAGALTMSVPRSIHRMVTVPSGRGIPKRMYIRNGEICKREL